MAVRRKSRAMKRRKKAPGSPTSLVGDDDDDDDLLESQYPPDEDTQVEATQSEADPPDAMSSVTQSADTLVDATQPPDIPDITAEAGGLEAAEKAQGLEYIQSSVTYPKQGKTMVQPLSERLFPDDAAKGGTKNAAEDGAAEDGVSRNGAEDGAAEDAPAGGSEGHTDTIVADTPQMRATLKSITGVDAPLQLTHVSNMVVIDDGAAEDGAKGEKDSAKAGEGDAKHESTQDADADEESDGEEWWQGEFEGDEQWWDEDWELDEEDRTWWGCEWELDDDEEYEWWDASWEAGGEEGHQYKQTPSN